jgi:hypothetical protein
VSIELHLYIESTNPADLARRDRLIVLLGQLTIIRMRAEQGIPVPVEFIARAEGLARTLVLAEAA